MDKPSRCEFLKPITLPSPSIQTKSYHTRILKDKTDWLDYQRRHRSGNVAALGSWNTASAVALGASGYTSSNPLWAGTVNLAPNTVVQYKFIKVDSAGTATWEADPNHTLTVPCAATTVASSWQS